MSLVVYLKIFAGLGLFFVGINFFSEHLKNHGKPYIRKIIKALAGSGWRSMASGALSGAVTNSAKAVTFSLAPIISSGLLTVPKAMPIIIGASFGSALLVLWVSFDFKLMELFLLGTAGLYYQFGNMRKSPTKFIAGMMLGLGLIFFGLDMLKGGAAALKDSEGFMNFATSTHGYWVLALLLGAATAFVTQSGSTMSIVAISFVSTGVLDFNQTVMFIYGTNVGSGISTAMLSFGMAGTARQLVMFHAAIKVVGSFLLVPALYVETYMGIPLMKAFSALLASDPGAQIGAIYVAYEVVAGAFMWLMIHPAANILGKVCPPSLEETLSQARYLRPDDNMSIDTGLKLIAKEQARILKRALRYFDSVRADIPERDKIGFDMLFEANTSLQKDIHQQLNFLSTQAMNKKQTEDVLHRHSIHEWIDHLDSCLFELARQVEKTKDHKQAAPILDVILKAIHVMLVNAGKALESNDAVKAQLLIESMKNRVSMLRRAKPKNLTQDLALQKTLLRMIVTYERTVWVVINFAHTLAHDDVATHVAPGSKTAAPQTKPPRGTLSVDTISTAAPSIRAQAPAGPAPVAASVPKRRPAVDYAVAANSQW